MGSGRLRGRPPGVSGSRALPSAPRSGGGTAPPAEQVEVKTEAAVEGMSLGELQALRARLLREHPELARLALVE